MNAKCASTKAESHREIFRSPLPLVDRKHDISEAGGLDLFGGDWPVSSDEISIEYAKLVHELNVYRFSRLRRLLRDLTFWRTDADAGL